MSSPLTGIPPRVAVGYTLLVTLTVAAALCSIQAGVATGPARAWWWLGAALSAAGLGARAVWRERQTANAITTAAEVTDQLADRLHQEGQALLGALCDVTGAASGNDRQAALKSLTTLACQTAHTACGRGGAHRRAVFYQLHGDHLERVYHCGRSYAAAPRPHFAAGHSLHDDEVMRLATSEDVLVVDDLLTGPPPHFHDSASRSYRSLIAIPVRAGHTSHGLLIVDANHPHAFGDRDKANLALVAGTLAAALAHCHTVASITTTHAAFVVPALPGADDLMTTGAPCGPL